MPSKQIHFRGALTHAELDGVKVGGGSADIRRVCIELKPPSCCD